MSKQAKQQVLHEREALRHRIVIIQPGNVATGPWTSNDKFAELNGWFANNGASSQLRWGVFKVVGLAQQVLA